MGPPPGRPGGPELLIGGTSHGAVRRAARFADGYISGGGAPPQIVDAIFKKVVEQWREAERTNEPRLTGLAYFALGPDAKARSDAYLTAYYGFLGDRAKMIADNVIATPEAVRATVRGYEGIGMDELDPLARRAQPRTDRPPRRRPALSVPTPPSGLTLLRGRPYSEGSRFRGVAQSG